MDRVTSFLRSPAPAWLALALLLAVAAYESFTLYRISRFNRLISAPKSPEITEASPPELVFAKAHALAAKGDRREAQRLYGILLDRGDGQFQARVRYNLGTLYLREAAELWNARGVLEYIRVNTLVAVAKENFRESLRLKPERWDARYNLEYTYRITPPPKEKPKADFQGSKGSVFATLPSLPGGGP